VEGGNPKEGVDDGAAMAAEMMDAVWDVWGHRNSVEKEDAASQASREVNVHIVEECRKGFDGLDRKSQK